MMPGKKLLWQIFPTYLLIILIAIIPSGWYALSSLKEFYYEQTVTALKARASLVAHQVRPLVGTVDLVSLGGVARELGHNAAARITLIDPSGAVLADSDEDPSRMDNHSDRPEIRDASSGEMGVSVRFSKTLNKKLMYLAVPLKDGEKVLGTVRVAVAVTFIDQTLGAVQERIALDVVLVAFLAALIGFGVSRRISRPLVEMRQIAERFARGDLGGRIRVSGSDEIGGLAEALNQMAAQLDDRIRTITTQRNEREAVLSSMVEGVMAVDTHRRLISMNDAAADLLGIDPDSSQGKNINELVRNVGLQDFISRALRSSQTVESDIVAGEREDRFIQCHGTVLRGELNKAIGALIVLNDITRLRRLENMRRDFVANVSHELKTPITSIKGFVETLLSGEVDEPQNARRFLEIIMKQADRLNAIIEDLLSLSRIEKESGESQIVREESGLKELLESAIQDCSRKAMEKGIKVALVCPDDLRVRVNSPLLGQAVVNLIDNAVKYSEPDGIIEVVALKNASDIVIRVRDQGLGIEASHLPRLFERFYRVDPARSRKLGGTGLGLAIVKHIAQAHGGTVAVESQLGKGSTFSIHIPFH